MKNILFWHTLNKWSELTLKIYFYGTLLLAILFFILMMSTSIFPYSPIPSLLPIIGAPLFFCFLIIVPFNTFILSSLFLLSKVLSLVKHGKRISHHFFSQQQMSPILRVYFFVLVPYVIFLLIVQFTSFVSSATGMFYVYSFIVLFIAWYVVFFIGYFALKKHIFNKYTILPKILSIMVALGLCGFFCYYAYIWYDETQPHEYFTFRLDDPKGIYKLNYDGDYWLTYYVKKTDCFDVWGKTTCREFLDKKGNTAITETPVDLTPYLDKDIEITGSFVPSHGATTGNDKKLCVKGKCSVSPGPGYWYASPLKIKTIRLK